jgi:hypothetical protein
MSMMPTPHHRALTDADHARIISYLTTDTLIQFTATHFYDIRDECPICT